MKFTLTIDCGNDAARTYSDIRDMLKDVRAYLREFRGADEKLELNDAAPIRDANGNTVGTWDVTDQPLDHDYGN